MTCFTVACKFQDFKMTDRLIEDHFYKMGQHYLPGWTFHSHVAQ